MQAVGYREVVEYLTGNVEHGTGDRGRETGEGALTDCIDRVKARTRQFARRQETWFRALSECTWVPVQEGAEPARVAEQIVELAAKGKVIGSATK